MHQRTDGVHSIRITVQDECSEKKSPLARWNVVRIASNGVPLIVSKADVKATGQPRLPDPKESVWFSIRMCSEGPRRRTMLLPVTGKMRLQIQPQIQLLISNQILHLGRCKFAFAHSSNWLINHEDHEHEV